MLPMWESVQMHTAIFDKNNMKKRPLGKLGADGDKFVLGQGKIPACCEKGNKNSGFRKRQDFFHKLGNYQLLKNSSPVWNYLVVSDTVAYVPTGRCLLHTSEAISGVPQSLYYMASVGSPPEFAAARLEPYCSPLLGFWVPEWARSL